MRRANRLNLNFSAVFVDFFSSSTACLLALATILFSCAAILYGIRSMVYLSFFARLCICQHLHNRFCIRFNSIRTTKYKNHMYFVLKNSKHIYQCNNIFFISIRISLIFFNLCVLAEEEKMDLKKSSINKRHEYIHLKRNNT